MAKKFNDSIDLAYNEIQNVVVQNLSSDPGAGLADGRIWYDTALDVLRLRANGATVSLAAGAGYSDEQAQDAIGTILVDSARIDLTYNDATPSITADLLTDSVDNTFLSNMVQSSIKGRAAGAGTGDPTDLTAAQVKTLLAVAPADITFAATTRLLGRATAAGGPGEEITLGADHEFSAGAIRLVAWSGGDITKAAAATSATIINSAVTNAKMADMAQSTIKGRAAAAGTGAPVDLSVAQVKTILGYAASEVAFTPAGNIAASTVQAAIQELETDLTALIEGRKWKDPVDAATTGALPNTPTYSSGAGTLTAGANAALAAQDGVTLAVGDDLLVKNQASTFQNGIYTVTAVGSGAAPWVLTRRADANSNVELQDASVLVENGTTLQGDIFTQINAIADLTAAAQSWQKTGDTNTVYAADGTTLTLTGNTFSVSNAGITSTQLAASVAGAGLTGGAGSALDVAVGAGLEISSDTVRIAAAAAGAGLVGGAGSALAVGAGTGITVNADDVAINTAVVPRLYAVNVTGGATSEVITHNLGTRDVHVTVYLLAGTFAEEEFTVERTSTNTITLRSAITIPATTYRVVVHG